MGADDIQSKATEFVKRVLAAGVGAVFLTEESLRNLVSEFKLPKEMVSGFLESAVKTRKEFFQNLTSEAVSKLSEKVDARALLDDLIARYHVDLHIRVGLSPKHKKAESEIDASGSESKE